MAWRELHAIGSYHRVYVNTSNVPASSIILEKRSKKGIAPSFENCTVNWFPREMTLRNERSIFILMTCRFPDLGSASDWSSRLGNLLQPMRGITQIWVVTRHQYGISLLVHQASFRGETSVGVVKSRLFSEATVWTNRLIVGSVCRVPASGRQRRVLFPA